MAEADNKDPSMDEILQSIKRIISEETDGKDSQQPDEDVLELTDMVQDDGSVVTVKGASEADLLESIDKEIESQKIVEAPAVPQQRIELEAFDEPALEEVHDEPEERPDFSRKDEIKESSVLDDSQLISEEVASDASNKFDELRSMVTGTEHAYQPIASPHFRSGTTVEDLVMESLKPMLKEWLDLNLSEIVEKIVEREVRRISGR